MTLNAAKLASDLAAIGKDPPATVDACAAKWAQAVCGYLGGVTPTSLGAPAALPVLTGALKAAFAGTDRASVATSLESAFKAAATTVGGAMTGFTGTAPTTNIGFATLFEANYDKSHDDAAQNLASAIDTWAKTGKAVSQTTPPVTSTWI